MMEQYISDLLYKFDTVILPGFGAFVLKYQPAAFDSNTNQLSPPSKLVSFDGSIKNNDGILANFISDKEKISFFEACSKILAFVEEINKTLDSGNNLTMVKLGTFSKSAENALIFSPDASINYNLEVFGMGTISAPPISSATENSNPQQTDSIKVIPLQKKRRFPKAAIWILVIVVVLGGSGAALFFLKPDLIQNLKISELLNLGEKKDTIKNKTEQKISEKHEVQKSELNQDTINTDTASQNISNQNNQFVQSTNGNFHTISASFRIKENADNYVQTLKQKGYDSKVFFLPEKGMYVVSYNSYATKEEAEAALVKIRSSENPGAWVLNN